jgi:hypothetical protein
MKTDRFDQFVADQQVDDVDPQIMQEWFAALGALYNQVESFLAKHLQSDQIHLERGETELHEELLGTYRAPTLTLRIGKHQQIRLVPIGTMLVSCKGRVDMEGVAGTAQLLLVDERARRAADLFKVVATVGRPNEPRPGSTTPTSWVWKILTNSADRVFLDLDQNSFFEIILEISNG